MKYLLLLIMLGGNLLSGGQENIYQKDLQALRSVLEKTPSFSVQIKGKKQKSFDSLYTKLVLDPVSSPRDYQYFFNLSQLVFALKDNHLGFYQLPGVASGRENGGDTGSVGLNVVDSLEKILAYQPVDSLEGIYYYQRFYTVGIFKSSFGTYTGVIFQSAVDNWTRGHIAIMLYRLPDGRYNAIYRHPVFKNFMLKANEKYKSGVLLNSKFYASYSDKPYSKYIDVMDYVNVCGTGSKFQLRRIDHNTQYMMIRTFQSDSRNNKASVHFYDSIKGLITANYLILDLRNNEGGSYRESNRYLKLLKKYLKEKAVYVLVNNQTVSQAEIFLLKLRRFKRVTVLGETTNGMLSYGSNYGKIIKLPSGYFSIYPTDMKGSRKLLQYEDAGIPPDIALDVATDWIEQAISIIQKKQHSLRMGRDN